MPCFAERVPQCHVLYFRPVRLPPPKSMVRSRSRSDRKVRDHTICGCGGAIIHCVVQEVLACGTERWGPCQTSHSARPGFLQSHDCPIKASSETLYRRFPAPPSAPGNLCGDRLWTPHKICENRTSALQITVCARMLYCIYLHSVHLWMLFRLILVNYYLLCSV